MVDGEPVIGVGTAQSSKLLDDYVSVQSTENIYEECKLNSRNIIKFIVIVFKDS